jgi:CspA family cold shock protein
MPTGTVKKFFTERRFGFITPDGGGDDVFVRVTALEGTGSEELVEGQHVEFEVEQGPKGPQAQSVRSA